MKRLLTYLILIMISNSFVRANDQIQAFEKQLKESKSDSETVWLHNELAWAYKKSNAEKALDHNNKAISLCEEKQFKRPLADAYNTKGVILKAQGDFENSLKYQLNGLRLVKELGDKRGAANYLNNIGSFYRMQKDNTKALEYYDKALANFEELEDTTGIAMVYGQIGISYGEMEKKDLSYEYLERSIALKRKLGNQNHLAIGLLNLGLTQLKDQLFKLAESNVMEATQVFEELGDKIGLAYGRKGLSEIYFNQGNLAKGVSFGYAALKLAEEIGHVDFQIECHDLLYQEFKKSGDHHRALNHVEASRLLNDSIFDVAKTKQIAELETKYQTEQKEQKIALLDEKNKVQEMELIQKNRLLYGFGGSAIGVLIIIVLIILNQRNKAGKKDAEFAKKRSELKQAALRAQMNPHFLFNSLNSIQRIYVEGNMMLANDYMADFSSLLRSILNNSDKESISLKEDLQMLELYMTMEKVRTDGQINYTIQVDSNVDQNNTQIPPMIIQPFVENAIWHGILPNKKKGNITISIQKHEDSFLECTVEDDGIGIVSSRKNKKKGHISKGMTLTKDRLGQKGQIKEEELETGGTRITINIPTT